MGRGATAISTRQSVVPVPLLVVVRGRAPPVCAATALEAFMYLEKGIWQDHQIVDRYTVSSGSGGPSVSGNGSVGSSDSIDSSGRSSGGGGGIAAGAGDFQFELATAGPSARCSMALCAREAQHVVDLNQYRAAQRRSSAMHRRAPTRPARRALRPVGCGPEAGGGRCRSLRRRVRRRLVAQDARQCHKRVGARSGRVGRLVGSRGYYSSSLLLVSQRDSMESTRTPAG